MHQTQVDFVKYRVAYVNLDWVRRKRFPDFLLVIIVYCL